LLARQESFTRTTLDASKEHFKLTVSITGLALALQLAFTAFLSGILEVEL
jgi:hypothetical protein